MSVWVDQGIGNPKTDRTSSQPKTRSIGRQRSGRKRGDRRNYAVLNRRSHLKAFAKKAGYKIVSVWKEIGSGAKDDRAQRKEVLALAQARKVDVILVTELTRWGRSMLDLFRTLQDLQSFGVSLVAQTGLQFDLRSAHGKLIASMMAALAEFEHDLLRERVRSGIAAARKRGVVFGRRPGQRVKADRFASRVLTLVGEG
jgi:putative DNA-invertase from lambdoid prophage Rac